MTDETKTEKVERTCANCACLHEIVNPLNATQKQTFCRRDPAQHKRMRVEVPRLDREKKLVMGKNGHPILESQEADFFLYPPMDARLVCFDGWRPIGTKPGEDFKREEHMTKVMGEMQKHLAKLSTPWDSILGDTTYTGAVQVCPHGAVIGDICAMCPNEIAAVSVDDGGKTN